MDKQCQQIIKKISQVVIGKEEQVRLALACLLAKGHLLIEDLPGMGKTTLSHTLASAVGMSYNRVQFTSDLLPADIIGVSIFKADTHEFKFHPGPIFSQLLLADEINRASPKTQSALLEAMAENQVSVDGTTYPLESPFFVIATQNPQFQSGTYPLPESQLDRFLMRISLGFPPHQAELSMLKRQTQIDLSDYNCISYEELATLQAKVESIYASDEVLNYILALVNLSRESRDFPLSLSPRASLAILAAAKAWAYIDGAEYVTPDHVQAIFLAVTEHRLSPSFVESGSTDSLSVKLLNSVDPTQI
ncbi:AAA family ATPase [Catenovulum maritimum]|uniref:ATPase AAA n=1 Tax=Catenovulum maritimum TaxID=1513271 RepID=A0A0J8GV93_9ALTE|nr:AAA family ATPase [Catenovulum maritimum]KMT66657.1 ATPase AAA [Catenovulum maritimum]